MDAAVLAARLVLAAVFAVAAIGKLVDPRGFRETLFALGAPLVAVPTLAVVIPAVELVIAAGLCVGTTAQVAAAGALGLLLIFSAAIARALARGERPDCHCLGQLRAGPAGEGTLARNFALALVAGLVLVS